MEDSRIKSARELLGAFFDEEKLGRAGRYTEFFGSWKYLVGDHLAAHSHVADVDRGKLVVEADHPGWIQLLQLRQKAILDGVASRFPELELRSIVFRLGSARPLAKGYTPPTPVRPAPPPDDPDFPPQPPRSLDTIEDPALKRLLSSLKSTMEGEGSVAGPLPGPGQD
jgi:hypothetical protein